MSLLTKGTEMWVRLHDSAGYSLLKINCPTGITGRRRLPSPQIDDTCLDDRRDEVQARHGAAGCADACTINFDPVRRLAHCAVGCVRSGSGRHRCTSSSAAGDGTVRSDRQHGHRASSRTRTTRTLPSTFDGSPRRSARSTSHSTRSSRPPCPSSASGARARCIRSPDPTNGSFPLQPARHLSPPRALAVARAVSAAFPIQRQGISNVSF
jgi:hypothetical protein